MAQDSTANEFTKLLDYLKASRGFDFSAYKVSSLMRRIQKRMREVGVASYSEYTDYLEVHPNEFVPLFDTVLINVTSFFRDPEAWQFIQEQIIPRVLEERGPDHRIRVWSAGCASGEEAFTISILMAEAMGEEAFRRRVKIYATDADEGALSLARQGSYEDRQVAGVPAELLEKYFDQAGPRYVFRPEMRRCLIFGRHDLIQDAAISRIDLLTCRNTLMYFNSEAQEKILARFHFALNKTGYLFLGKAETLISQGGSFRPVDLKSRVFVRAGNSQTRDRLLALSMPGPSEVGGLRGMRLREAALDAGAAAQIVIDRRGSLALYNERARSFLNLGASDLGRPFQDLEVSFRPVELRSRIEETQSTRTAVQIKDVEWHLANSEPRHLEIQIVPLFDTATGFLGTSLSFLDHTRARQLQTDVERIHQELETAYEELQSANEELETTNEELQSTIEELETTNEELQSANEELETMNEELQSTNEELQTMNDQLQQSFVELDQVNRSLATVLASLRAAVVVLDRDLQVKVWSDKAEDLWGLRADEVNGQAFLDLDIGLPVRELQEPLRECLTERNGKETELNGINRRGKPVRCRVRCAPLVGRGTDDIIVLVEDLGAGGSL